MSPVCTPLGEVARSAGEGTRSAGEGTRSTGDGTRSADEGIRSTGDGTRSADEGTRSNGSCTKQKQPLTNIVFCSLLCVVKSHGSLESTVLIIPDCHHGVAHEEPLLRHMVLLLHSLIIFPNQLFDDE